MPNKMTVNHFGAILVVLLWLGSFTLGVIRLSPLHVPFEPAAVVGLLGLLSIAVTAMVKKYASRLEFEEYTPARALAYGYANHYIEPVVTELLKRAAPGEEIRLYIYIPSTLSELGELAVTRTVATVKTMGYRSEYVDLHVDAGRPRNVLRLSGKSDDIKYLDFPKTLRALTDWVDYKVESKGGSFAGDKRAAEEHKYIEAFKKQLGKLLAEKGIEEHVLFADSSLTFLA